MGRRQITIINTEMAKNMKNWWCFSGQKPKIVDLSGIIYTDSDLEKVEGAIAPLQPQFHNSLLGFVYV